jgi:hypothetical protein
MQCLTQLEKDAHRGADMSEHGLGFGDFIDICTGISYAIGATRSVAGVIEKWKSKGDGKMQTRQDSGKVIEQKLGQ